MIQVLLAPRPSEDNVIKLTRELKNSWPCIIVRDDDEIRIIADTKSSRSPKNDTPELVATKRQAISQKKYGFVFHMYCTQKSDSDHVRIVGEWKILGRAE